MRSTKHLPLHLLLLFLALALPLRAEEKPEPPPVWLSGDVFIENNVLLFRAEKPIEGNTTGDVVLLGTTKAAADLLLPAYEQAAEKGVRLRLYGVLMPRRGEPPDWNGPLPSLQFVTWKVHLPDEPDDPSTSR